jgi:hypothetical protein
MRIGFYVDGFNLYYRALKGTASKWLDVVALCQRLTPKATVASVRYFTARIQPTPGDPSQAQRQQAYLRALETLPKLSVHYGHFLANPKTRPLAKPGKSKFVTVWDREEKGSDVNLASYLLRDAFQGRFDGYAVVSNDSDLATPVRMVREEIGRPLTVWSPERRRPSKELRMAAGSSGFRTIRRSAYSKCQLSQTLYDSAGAITKPAEW